MTFQFAWGMPGLLLYIACGYFMEGIGRPRAGMAIMLAANVLNLLADGIVVLGDRGLVEPMGAAGAMMTTSAIRWGIFAAMLAVVLSQSDRAKYGIGRGAPRETGIVKGIWRIGLPVAATGGIENGAYATLAQMAGLLGAASLAAHPGDDQSPHPRLYGRQRHGGGDQRCGSASRSGGATGRG
ncbi:MAG: hypothetical protein U1F24_08185 [Alphaproteobacteria bacterium]